VPCRLTGRDTARTTTKQSQCENENFIFHGRSCSPCVPAATKEKGVTYSRSATGTGMPSWNAFRHARLGLSSAPSMISKLPVLLRTAAEATQICCVGLSYIRFLER
jgi:hypothetical protein